MSVCASRKHSESCHHLVAHYSFDDGTAADDSGAGLDGWVSGATATTGLVARGALVSTARLRRFK